LYVTNKWDVTPGHVHVKRILAEHVKNVKSLNATLGRRFRLINYSFLISAVQEAFLTPQKERVE
jgi:REP element-mobilizing transposase RayT